MGNDGQVKHVFSGKIQKLPFKKIEIETAIFKSEVFEPVYVNKLGIESDEQGDKKYHGGPEQALCVYLDESYKYWTKYKERHVESGCFGENLVLSQLKEDDVHIGDVYKIGDITVQVSQPRQPCSRLGFRNDWPEMVVISRNSKLTGFYLRVIEEGYIKPDDEITLLSRVSNSISIKDINGLLYENDVKIEQLQHAVSLEHLAESFKKDLQKKLDKLQNS